VLGRPKLILLSQGLEQGSPFPPFSDYHETFSSRLTPDMFASFTIPLWVPQPPQLLRFAKAIYPYWKERRLERSGHRIIPILNVSSGHLSAPSFADTSPLSLTNLMSKMSPTSASGGVM